MGTTPSPIHGYSLPDSNTKISGTRAAFNTVATQIEITTVMRFQTVAEMATKITPRSGMVAWIIGTKQLLLHNGTDWVQLYPDSPAILTGTALPANTLGKNGDFYFRG